MKANEATARYTGKVRECTNYAVRSIKNLYKDEDEIKDRFPYSESEKNLQKKLKTDLEIFSDCVEVQDYKAKVGTHKIPKILNFVFSLISSVSLILAILVSSTIFYVCAISALFSLLSICGAFDFLCKKVTTSNIIATRKSSSDSTHKVVFIANTDAPYRNRMSFGFEKFLFIMSFLGSILQLGYSGFEIAVIYNKNLISQSFMGTFDIVGYVLSAFIIFPIFLLFSINYSKVTMGIANNLSGCYACCGAMRYLSELDLKFDNTDVSVVLTSGKNECYAGAKAYLDSNLENDKKQHTHYIFVDTLRDFENFGVVSQSKEELKFMAACAADCGVDLNENSAHFITSDSSVFNSAHVPCVTLTTLDKKEPDFYNTVLDNLDSLDVKSTEATIKILLESVYLLNS